MSPSTSAAIKSDAYAQEAIEQTRGAVVADLDDRCSTRLSLRSSSSNSISRGRTGRERQAPIAAPASSRWRSSSRTLRGESVAPKGDKSRSRSRSLRPFAKDVSRSRSRAPQAGALHEESDESVTSQQATPADPEKGTAESTPPWYKRKPFKSPLLPLLEKIPLWLEGYIWGWIGGFVGLGCILIIFTRASAFTDSSDVQHGAWTSPAIVGSFGASAVLLFSCPAAPLSQPRSFFGGQVISSIIGVAITKLFALSPHFNINDTNHDSSLVWVAGGVATATAIMAMQITRTIHPPGGATAILAATSPPVAQLGWHYIPVIILSSAVMMVWALIWMNAGRKSYPEWWFFPPENVRKSAFPGPELGVYVKKWQEHRLRKARHTSLLPIANEKVAHKQREVGALPRDDAWEDETRWRATTDQPSEVTDAPGQRLSSRD